MKIKKNKLIVLISISGFILFMIWGQRFTFAKYWYMKDFFKGSPEKKIKSLSTQMREDHEVLSVHDIFSPHQGNKNAGGFLNPRITWEIGPHFHQGELSLPKSWPNQFSLKTKLDFSWLEKISAFDHWTLERFPAQAPVNELNLTFPTYRDFLGWQKLRYLDAKNKGDELKALKEIRHLMRLIWTNENEISSSIVLQMLEHENTWLEALKPAQRQLWKGVAPEHLKRAKRLLTHTQAALDIRLSDDTFHQLNQSSLFVCPALYQAQLHYLHFKPYLESELTHGYRRLKDFITSSGCRSTLLESSWKETRVPSDEEISQLRILGMNPAHAKGSNRQEALTAVGYILAAKMWPAYPFSP